MSLIVTRQYSGLVFAFYSALFVQNRIEIFVTLIFSSSVSSFSIVVVRLLCHHRCVPNCPGEKTVAVRLLFGQKYKPCSKPHLGKLAAPAKMEGMTSPGKAAVQTSKATAKQ